MVRVEAPTPPDVGDRSPGPIFESDDDEFLVGGDQAPSSPSTRRERTRQRTQRRTLVVILALAVVVGVIAALVGERRNESSGESSEEAAEGEAVGGAPGASAPHVGLFAHTDPSGEIDVVALVGVEGAGRGGSVVLVPPTSLLEVPSVGQITIAELGTLDDQELLQTTLENALGVDVETVTLLDDATLAAAIAPVGELEVDLHRAIRIQDERGTLALPEGEQVISAADAMRLLTAETEEGALDRLVIVQAVLDGWFGALAESTEARDATLDTSLTMVTITAAAGAEVRYETLPVDRLSATVDEELYALDRAAVRSTMQEAFPNGLLGPVDDLRPRVEILNGTGAIGITRDITATIVPVGVEVTLSGNVPGFGVERTQVVYYRDSGRADAERIVEALGAGTVALADEALGVIDVTIVIGADLPGAEPPPEAGVPGELVEGSETPAA